MAKPARLPAGPVRFRRGGSPESVVISVRGTVEQKSFLSRLGDGSLSLGFDRAIAAAAAVRDARS